jgi:hypothetical protein
MLRNRWFILIGVVVVLGLLVWGWQRGSQSRSSVDLLPAFAQAEKRSGPMPPAEAIKETKITINGEAKNCILEQPTSRILFHLTPPADAWFNASIALDPSVWDKEGDGVLFRMGIGDGKGAYEELLTQHVNPMDNPSDRRWIPVAVDLSAFAGQDIYLILNTNASLPRKPVDTRNDLAVWGDPKLVVGK